VLALVSRGLAALVLILAATAPGYASGVTFNFQFDDSGGGPDGSVTPPIVGTGVFTIATDPGLGTFALSSLGSYSMSFSLDGYTLTDANIASDPSEVLVVISSYGASQERVYFTDSGGGAGGPFGGSLDLINYSTYFGLSFEPSYAGGHNTYVDALDDNGNYLGVTAVPEPASMIQFGIGLCCCLAGFVWGRRRMTAVA
jgi:hypothetical protein